MQTAGGLKTNVRKLAGVELQVRSVRNDKGKSMPVKVRKINGLYRLIEADTGRIAMTAKGNPVDGGTAKTGSTAEMKAKRERQASRINQVYAEKKG